MKKSLGAKTLVVPTPVWIVGTYDIHGKANAAAVAWGGICCGKPPCVAVSLRAATYTHGGILLKKAFTVSVPSAAQAKVADYLGMASGRDTDKFKAAGLTPVKSDLVDAPYVAEFPLVVECKLVKVVELGLHTQFVGEILDVKSDAATMGDVKPFLYSPLEQAYYAIGAPIGKAFEIGKSVGK